MPGLLAERARQHVSTLRPGGLRDCLEAILECSEQHADEKAQPTAMMTMTKPLSREVRDVRATQILNLINQLSDTSEKTKEYFKEVCSETSAADMAELKATLECIISHVFRDTPVAPSLAPLSSRERTTILSKLAMRVRKGEARAKIHGEREYDTSAASALSHGAPETIEEQTAVGNALVALLDRADALSKDICGSQMLQHAARGYALVAEELCSFFASFSDADLVEATMHSRTVGVILAALQNAPASSSCRACLLDRCAIAALQATRQAASLLALAPGKDGICKGLRAPMVVLRGLEVGWQPLREVI